MVRDTSDAVSIARSVMLGCSVGWGRSYSTCMILAKAMKPPAFGYPRVRLFLNSGPDKAFGYPRQAP